MFGQLVQQFMPNFTSQRSLYEVRERPSKTYGWKVFILTNIVAELPWAILSGTIFFFVWYYPIGYYHNASYTNAVHIRGFLTWFFVVQFFLYTSTFATAVVAGMENPDTAGNIANLLVLMCMTFCG